MDRDASVDRANERPAGLEDASREQAGVQEEHLALLRRYEAEHHWRSQLSALVPFGLCLTDGAGTVLDANPALAAQLQVGLHRLPGKPLSGFLDPEDVPTFRAALRQLTGDRATTYRSVITIRGHRSQNHAELFGFLEAPGRPDAARVQWVLVPEPRAHEPAVLTPASPPSYRRADAAQVPADAPDRDDSLRLAMTLARLSLLPTVETGPQRLLTEIARLVHEVLPVAAWVSVTLGSPLDPQRLGSNTLEAQEFDGLQLRAQQGPCQDAYRTGTTVLSIDAAADPRWPVLAPLAAGGPVHGVLALPVHETPELAGVLALYSPARDAFDTESRRIAELVGTAVTGALGSSAERRALRELAAHLQAALTSRAVIDQAKGILMGRLGLDADEAFLRLVALSSRLNIKVRDLAPLITEGRLDPLIDAAE